MNAEGETICKIIERIDVDIVTKDDWYGDHCLQGLLIANDTTSGRALPRRKFAMLTADR